MKTATILAALPATMASFTGLSVRSGSAIQYGSINANGGYFFINKPTTSYCPEAISDLSLCPPGNTTVFSGGNDTLYLDVEVPGGQQVYFDNSGAMTFTTPHSTFMREGAVSTGFAISEGGAFDVLSWTNGFLACPTNGSAPYQVYGAVPSFNLTDCIGFDFFASDAAEIGAWEYV